ncbi:RNA polymerase factor sigma-54 [Flavobacterium okayamense]|uniref:RNA polymerase sigma-54 factor n=1 Tax=Flavobacterium okayamense TaxID=2830782 RepID=A0ABN6HU57_9FLAO|nr:RNA polymerase factor sigma-54 [Flavobacterium okayamense]BCY28014.1 RNA polymerase sigma-54 factor [Flavobacterium okayamense]
MLKQNLQLKLSQKLSPQQIQLMKLIQLPTQAFEQRLQEEMVENPALESGKEDNVDFDEYADNSNDDFDDYDNEHIDTDDINIDEYLSNDETPDYKYQTNNYSDDDDDKSMPFVAGVTFHQDLLNQLNTFVLDDTERDVAEFIVGSIDDTGYIRRTIQDMVDDMAFTQGIYTDENTVERILKHVVQELEPAGVAARDLQECLLLQLKHKTPTDSIELAISIIDDQFDAFTKKHYEKLLQKFDITKEQLRKAIEEIEKLNPKPGSSFSGNQKPIEHVVPDFTIRIVEGELDLILNGRNAPELHVSKDYQEMLQSYKDSSDKSAQKDAVQFIKQKLDSAKWFIDAIKQRQETLFVTMNAIMHYQEEYFLDGDETKLKPMILKDIADMVGLDISTVSRVANSKYVDTPYGTKLIKDFFSEAMKNTEGEDVSTIEIKKILQNVIEEEDKRKPLPDDKLAEILKDKGYPIARRTVAKYREQLDIPVARLRKKI